MLGDLSHGIIFTFVMTSEQDEILSEVVRKYPDLYDKSKNEHHDRHIMRNCWNNIAEECGLEDDKETAIQNASALLAK